MLRELAQQFSNLVAQTYLILSPISYCHQLIIREPRPLSLSLRQLWLPRLWLGAVRNAPKHLSQVVHMLKAASLRLEIWSISVVPAPPVAGVLWQDICPERELRGHRPGHSWDCAPAPSRPPH